MAYLPMLMDAFVSPMGAFQIFPSSEVAIRPRVAILFSCERGRQKIRQMPPRSGCQRRVCVNFFLFFRSLFVISGVTRKETSLNNKLLQL